MKKQKKLPFYRQGDVGMQYVASLPAGAKPVENTGRIVLAYGEVTGHAHAIAAEEAQEFTFADAGGVVRRFFQVMGIRPAVNAPVLLRAPGNLLLDMPDGPVKFSLNDVTDFGETATPTNGWGKLKHEEHDAHGLPAGFYEIVAQREYSPEAIRNVQD